MDRRSLGMQDLYSYAKGAGRCFFRRSMGASYLPHQLFFWLRLLRI